MFSASAIKQLPGNLVMDRIPCSNKNRLTTADRLEECNLQSLLWRDETPCTSSVKSEFRVRSFDLFRKEESEGVPTGH